mgnify:CR=1 FL=1
MQVAQALPTLCGHSHAQLLLQLESDMLLSLTMQQLAASIPASHPAAESLREVACQLTCSALESLQASGDILYQLPLATAYTGPQLALQVMSASLQPPAADVVAAHQEQ